MTQKEQVFALLGIKPNEIFKLKERNGLFLVDSNLTVHTNTSGGWAAAAFSIADILNGSQVVVKIEKVGCEFCSQTPVIANGIYDHFGSAIPYVSSSYEGAYIGANEKGEIIMFVCGDDISDDYPLNYCPECGRKLKEDK